MNRLLPELDRLYGLGTSAANGPAEGAVNAGLRHGVRALVLAVVLPARWQQLASVWRGVQSDLELPAPAIAVSGLDALQLWFSFASPISSSTGARFLHGLRERYLLDVASSQVGMFAEAAELPMAPCVEVGPQQWSAFVSHDLASLFAETPWLDTPPNDEGQATLLRTLEPIGKVAFDAALDRLGVTDATPPLDPLSPARPGSATASIAGRQDIDPARFLAGVMNDETAPLALRIEAARILLPYAERS